MFQTKRRNEIDVLMERFWALILGKPLWPWSAREKQEVLQLLRSGKT
jgi:hypothetical protein